MQRGFITTKKPELPVEPPKKTKSTQKVLSCLTCGLYLNVNTPKMAPFGNFKKGIMNIAEAPGETEDKNGKPFQGKAGKLLQKVYRELGIDLFEDCINIHANSCRPTDKEGKSRQPTPLETDCCRKFVLKAIEKYKPKVIILLGNAAIYSLIGYRWKKEQDGVNIWHGWQIPDQDFKCWICPTYHPSFILNANEKGYKSITANSLKSQSDSVETVVWKQDLQNAFDCLKKPFPEYVEPEIEVLEDLSLLETIQLGNSRVRKPFTRISFDYETTGLKPHAQGHKIVCCSIADSENHVFVFMLPESKEKLAPFLKILSDPSIKKWAQNMKFEHNWTKVRLDTTVQGWEWDTMQVTHILDNRSSITGLKFQSYVQFGVVDYDSEISPYLKAKDEKNGNAINRIMELVEQPGGKEKLMHYCALDSIYEFRLAMLQMKIIENANAPF